MEQVILDDLKAVALKHAKALALDMVVVVAFPALKQVVKESASPIDDMVLAALEEPLKKALLDLIDKI